MNQLEKQKSNIDYFIKMKNAVLEVVEDVNILRFEVDRKGVKKPALMTFIGKSAKQTNYYFYNSVERREERIAEIVKRRVEIAAEKQKRLEDKKAFVPTTKEGDIYVSSWGYEQTQVDFYLCQSVKGKTGTFIKIGGYTVDGSQCSSGNADRVMPSPEITFGEPFKKLIKQSGSSESIRLKSYEYCHKWSGSSMHRSWGY